MVAVKGDVIVVRPRSKVKRRFSCGVNVVYRGLGVSVVDWGGGGGGFGGVGGSGGSENDACGLLFDFDRGFDNNIVYVVVGLRSWTYNMESSGFLYHNSRKVIFFILDAHSIGCRLVNGPFLVHADTPDRLPHGIYVLRLLLDSSYLTLLYAP